ncbi:cell wall-binding repeat-containing protein [Palaeococcus sp. (in: euryarchaeotes)]
MMWKKAFAMLFGLLVLASSVPMIKADAAVNMNLVILVSDNEADYALAEKLAENLNVSVVVTPWGIYDSNITAEIASYAPDSVLIIGGPAAVPKLYEDDLQNLNITWFRIWGSDRYETNIKVLEYVMQNYPDVLKDVKIVIANGRDMGAIKKIGNSKKVFPIYVNANNTDNQTKILGIMKVTGVIIIKTPFSANITERIRERVREKVQNVTEENENITAEMAWEAIEIAQNKTALAESLIDNATNPSAPKLLELAKKELNNAMEAYNESEYGKAYGQAIAAKAHAEVVIRFASEDFQERFHKNLQIRAEVEIMKVERIIERFDELGMNVTAANATLEQAKNAYDEGKYGEAFELAKEAEKILKDIMHEEKALIREHVRERIKHRKDKWKH